VNIVILWLALVLSVREVSGSNLGYKIDSHD